MSFQSLGINDLLNFDFMDRPSETALIKSLEQLYALGALSDTGELTKTGKRMAEFPLDPLMARALLASDEYGCSEEVASIMAMLSIQSALFYRPKDKKTHADMARRGLQQKTGDHLTLLHIWNTWVRSGYDSGWCYDNFIQVRSMKRARDVRDQIVGLLKKVEAIPRSSQDDVAIRKSILAGYFFNAARAQLSGDTAAYKVVKQGSPVFIHPTCCLYGQFPKWIVYHELVLTSKEYIRQVSEINPEWLLEVAPHYFKRDEIMSSEGKFPKNKGA